MKKRTIDGKDGREDFSSDCVRRRWLATSSDDEDLKLEESEEDEAYFRFDERITGVEVIIYIKYNKTSVHPKCPLFRLKG